MRFVPGQLCDRSATDVTVVVQKLDGIASFLLLHLVHALRPLTHAPEIGAITSSPDSGASFSVVPMHDFRRRYRSRASAQKKLAPESGVEFRPIAPIFETGFWSVCQGP